MNRNQRNSFLDDTFDNFETLTPNGITRVDDQHRELARIMKKVAVLRPDGKMDYILERQEDILPWIIHARSCYHCSIESMEKAEAYESLKREDRYKRLSPVTS